MTVRPARPEDAPRMGAILSDWIDATPWMPRLHTREEDAAFCAALVPHARVSGDADGFIAVDGANIPALYVAQAARRQGHGRALLDNAKAGADRLSLWTFAANREALAFYAAQGFVQTARTDGDNDEGLPDVRLEWRRA